MIKIAYLILCHVDSEHIARLANKISTDNAHVYIHVDLESDINDFKNKLPESNNIRFIDERVKAYWGGFSAVQATINLMKSASKSYNYDRYILLQGLDYPIKSNEVIMKYFIENKDKEFIRGCNITKSNNIKLYGKCKMWWFFDKKNFWRKCLNKLNIILSIQTRIGYVNLGEVNFEIYWGAAQWALTGDCVKYVIDFYDKNEKVNKYFKHVFPADETYFHSVVFNSRFSSKTTFGGPEEENNELVNWRNLHYFEYPKLIKIFDENDYDFLLQQKCLFIRKTTTEKSSKLMDMIDFNNSKQDLKINKNF
ncbi:beta-1,6-N-acetylglucosaminyltransferase [Clostridium tertium]